MDKKKLEHFKKVLEERRDQLSKLAARNENEGRLTDENNAQDIADRALSSYNKEFLFSQSQNERAMLNMVKGALARLADGTFGQCISCAEDINERRLDAVPWTRHCIACQEKLERGELEQP